MMDGRYEFADPRWAERLGRYDDSGSICIRWHEMLIAVLGDTANFLCGRPIDWNNYVAELERDAWLR